MNKLLLSLILSGIISLIIVFTGCTSVSTRVEQDVYTIVDLDTNAAIIQKNAPGSRDNGIIYPSSKTITEKRHIVRHDSIVERRYPDFIRLGAFESVGLLFGGDKNFGIGTGLFGVFPKVDSMSGIYRGSNKNTFSGGLYRLGIGEWRLRWFRDAANWTYGTSFIEAIMPDARFEHSLISVFPIYIRKRYFLREEIPYIAFTPAFGVGYYPSQYINLSASMDVGSIAGLNIRAYLGFAAGINLKKLAFQVDPSVNEYSNNTSVSTTCLYGGIGISVLDFLNLVPETQQEWKYHKHSGWDIGLIQGSLLATGAKTSLFIDTKDSLSKSSFLNGFNLKIANAIVSIPIEQLQNKLYVGTSLINILALGESEWGIGILPIRVGYFTTVLADELTTEPFIEYNYYPSSFINLGNKLNLRMGAGINLFMLVGFASGNSDRFVSAGDINRQIGSPTSFSRPYFGIGIGVSDRIFFPEEIRYNKK